MTLPPSVDGFGEADVREEIITPLLHRLGYKAGSPANIIREQPLRYPREFLGHKKPRRDPPLRGRADYILDVDRLVRWTIEAKAPGDLISVDDIEQAYSYARHPEVRAVFFAIINGAELRVYQTALAPAARPILALQYADIAASITVLENLLGPDALRRDHPVAAPDVGRPIGPGLRSLVRIVSGVVEFQQCSPAVTLLDQISLFITEGSIERDVDGKLMIYVQARSPFRSVNDFNQRMGLGQLELHSPDTALSTSADAPTTFRQETHVTLPEGEEFPDLTGEGELVLLRNLICRSTTVAEGHLDGRRFVGSFLQRYDYLDLPTVGDTFVLNASGRFEAMLA